VTAVEVGSGTELSLHLKLPGDLPLEQAHEIAEQVERAIREAVPEVARVQTHLEPLAEGAAGTHPRAAEVAADRDTVARIVRETTGFEPQELRFVHTDDGLVAYLTLKLGGETELTDAHDLASRIEEAIRRERPEIAEVVVHTEPRA
jgi:divalent metal cation (Fe/Co/Zn/Cd) transporter